MFRRTATRRVSLKEFFRTEHNPLTLLWCKEYFFFGFLASMAFLNGVGAQEAKRQVEEGEVSPEVREIRRKFSDPRRPPWPVLHQKVVMMREGKLPHDDLALAWEQTKYYYPHDWLIPLELSQLLKYTTAAYLRTYVRDPDQLKREILQQLENILSGKVVDVVNQGRINRDVQELLTMVIADLRTLDMTADVQLVPTHT